MKRAVHVVLSLVLAAGTVRAAAPMTNSGNKALLFDLSGLANLGAGNFQGGVGGKYYVANQFALRLALGMQSTSSKITNPANPRPADELAEGKFTSFSFTVAPGIQYDVAASSSVVGYVGAQVSLTTTSMEETGSTVFNDPTPFSQAAHRKDTGTIFGAGILLGVEWFAWENVSFAAEYQLGFSAGSGKSNVTTPGGVTSSTDAPSTTVFGLGSNNAANLTLAVFF